MEIKGQTEEDAKKFKNDLMQIFADAKFESFRKLIDVNGKSFKKMSQESIDAALGAEGLTADDKALMTIVANTINSKKTHSIEYYTDKVSSMNGIRIFEDYYKNSKMDLQKCLREQGGIVRKVIETAGGDGVTGAIGRKSHSVVSKQCLNRAVISAHEVFGHGRGIELNRNAEEQQHIDAIQFENLVHRVMGDSIVNDGLNHGPRTRIMNPSTIPPQLIGL